MTIGVGGSTIEAELAGMESRRGGMEPITEAERRRRIGKAQRLMREAGNRALYLDASTSLYYFTGLRLRGSERLHGAVIPVDGGIAYIGPAFEEAAPFFTFDGLRRAGNAFDYVNGSLITAPCRRIKSPAEIALMQTAKKITLEVHRATARILAEGITTTEVEAFITEAHRRLGADGPPGFRIVLFGEPSARQRAVWNVEKAAQAAAARAVIENTGFGPGYAMPGLPHRPRHRPRRP